MQALVGATVLATKDGLAGKKREYNQATSQANACGNGELPLNTFCQNIDSQVQGDEIAVAASGSQSAPLTKNSLEPLEELHVELHVEP